MGPGRAGGSRAGAWCALWLLTTLLSQALLEDIERHGEKVEECQRFAKQYINAIKVRPLQPRVPGETCRWWAWDLKGAPQARPCWAKPVGRFRGRVGRAELAANQRVPAGL